MEATERADNESVASVQKHNEEGVGGPQHQVGVSRQ